MYITALIIGLGVYLLYRDLPAEGRAFANKYTWLSHAAVFFGLFAMHGGSAEGTVLAGIATVAFRWMQHTHMKRELAQHNALLTRQQYNQQQQAQKSTGPDADSDTYLGTVAVDLLTFACVAYLIFVFIM